MIGLIEEIVDWVRPAFDVAGYAIVPAAMFLESAALLGVVVPGDVLLAVSGVYVASGELSLVPVITLGVAGALLGEIAGYALGRRYGRSLIGHLPFAKRIERHVDHTGKAIRDNAGKAIVVGRFATGVAGLVPFTAGTAEVPFWRFLAYSFPLLVVWGTGVVLLGMLIGNNVDLIDRILSSVGLFVLGAVVLGLGGWWGWRKLREK